MNNYPLLLAASLAVMLGACSKSEQSATQASPPPAQNDKALLEMTQRPLDKARSVEGMLQQDAQHNREAIDKQTAPSQ